MSGDEPLLLDGGDHVVAEWTAMDSTRRDDKAALTIGNITPHDASSTAELLLVASL